jgi:hypothetical protein
MITIFSKIVECKIIAAYFEKHFQDFNCCSIVTRLMDAANVLCCVPTLTVSVASIWLSRGVERIGKEHSAILNNVKTALPKLTILE